MGKKQLLGAASAFVMVAGVAVAQNATTGAQAPAAGDQSAAPQTAPAATAPAPAAPSAEATPPNQPAGASAAANSPSPAPDTTANAAPQATALSQPATTDVAKQPSESNATGGPAVRADDMIGRSVQGSDGKALGKVKDAVVDASSGKIQKLVISSGGFLGIGAKNVAVDFDQVEVRPEGGIVAKSLTQKDIEGMPKYDVAADTKSLDQPPPAPTTAPAGGGMGATAGGATAPAPTAAGSSQ